MKLRYKGKDMKIKISKKSLYKELTDRYFPLPYLCLLVGSFVILKGVICQKLSG